MTSRGIRKYSMVRANANELGGTIQTSVLRSTNERGSNAFGSPAAPAPNTPNGAKIQAAWMENSVPQCGYCQAGQVMSACDLLNHTPEPTDEDIDSAMSGNICRCGTYTRIRAAIKDAAGLLTADTREI